MSSASRKLECPPATSCSALKSCLPNSSQSRMHLLWWPTHRFCLKWAQSACFQLLRCQCEALFSARISQYFTLLRNRKRSHWPGSAGWSVKTFETCAAWIVCYKNLHYFLAIKVDFTVRDKVHGLGTQLRSNVADKSKDLGLVVITKEHRHPCIVKHLHCVRISKQLHEAFDFVWETY